MWDDDLELLDEAGYDEEDDFVEMENEAGFLEFVIPAAVAADLKRRGKMPRPGTRRGKRTRRKRGLGGLARRINRNARAIREIRNMLRARKGSGYEDPSAAGALEGIRFLAGATLAVAAPGAVGMVPFGPLNIVAGADIAITHLLGEFAEDQAGAGNADYPAPPFLVNALSIARAETLKSNAPTAAGGAVFGAQGGNYGWPCAAGRRIKMPSGTQTAISGTVSPRVPAGAAPLDVTFTFLCRGITD